MKSDVSFLADDAQDGRAPGSEGIEASARLYRWRLQEGRAQARSGCRWVFPAVLHLIRSLTSRKNRFLRFRGPDGESVKPRFGADFTPLAIGTARILEKLPIVFAGYGITATKGPRGAAIDYDDYAGIDVKGKAVLILRREPQQHDENSPFDGKEDSRYATFQHKAVNAFQHGAAAVILVNNLAGMVGGSDRMLGFSQAGAAPLSNIPFLMLSRDKADKFLSAAGQPSLADLERKIDEDLKPQSREITGWALTAKINIEGEKTETKNVIGVLPGAGPHADETVDHRRSL